MFWIHASNAIRFEQSCREIAERAEIPGRNSNSNILKIVSDWLHGPARKWVIILDNLDDDSFLHQVPQSGQGNSEDRRNGTPERTIWEYFPQSLSGSMLITGRVKHILSTIVEESDILTIQPMDESQAIALFDQKVGMPTEGEETRQLVGDLDFMPLAIVQAASYIKQRAPRVTLGQYLERFHESDRKKIGLLTHKGGELRRDKESESAIFVTWQISFDHLYGSASSAAELLSIMSFFDRQGIPDIVLYDHPDLRLLEAAAATDDDTSSSGSDQDKITEQLENDILLLRNYSLISISTDGRSFEMHRLVQIAIQERLRSQHHLEKYKERFIQRLYWTFPSGNFETWETCALLFAHVKRAIDQRPCSNESLKEWASILHRASLYSRKKRYMADSEAMAVLASETTKELYGPTHSETLFCLERLALIHRHNRELEKAETLQVEVMEARKKALGRKHRDTITSMRNLSTIYLSQRRWKDAEELGVEVVKNDKRNLGPDHPNTLVSMGNLGSAYRNQGRWKDAEGIEVQVMESRKRVLGLSHPCTLTIMSNLSKTYQRQERWEEAEALDLHVLENRMRILGPDHPDTLNIMRGLANTYDGQGRWDEADAIRSREKEAHQRSLSHSFQSS